jgi:hypothetical protein
MLVRARHAGCKRCVPTEEDTMRWARNVAIFLLAGCGGGRVAITDKLQPGEEEEAGGGKGDRPGLDVGAYRGTVLVTIEGISYFELLSRNGAKGRFRMHENPHGYPGYVEVFGTYQLTHSASQRFIRLTSTNQQGNTGLPGRMSYTLESGVLTLVDERFTPNAVSSLITFAPTVKELFAEDVRIAFESDGMSDIPRSALPGNIEAIATQKENEGNNVYPSRGIVDGKSIFGILADPGPDDIFETTLWDDAANEITAAQDNPSYEIDTWVR